MKDWYIFSILWLSIPALFTLVYFIPVFLGWLPFNFVLIVPIVLLYTVSIFAWNDARKTVFYK
jgi:hypothetical protein